MSHACWPCGQNVLEWFGFQLLLSQNAPTTLPHGSVGRENLEKMSVQGVPNDLLQRCGGCVIKSQSQQPQKLESDINKPEIVQDHLGSSAIIQDHLGSCGVF